MYTRLEMEEIIKQAAKSHKWMLDTILHEGGNQDPAEHSDEVKHAVMVQELLETIE